MKNCLLKIILICLVLIIAGCSSVLSDDETGKPPTVDFKYNQGWLT